MGCVSYIVAQKVLYAVSKAWLPNLPTRLIRSAPISTRRASPLMQLSLPFTKYSASLIRQMRKIMSQEKKVQASWKSQLYISGLAIGAALGFLSAYLFANEAEKDAEEE